MDQKKQLLPHGRGAYLAPGYLLIGSPATLVTAVHAFMQSRWCLQGGCGQCNTCMLIGAHQWSQALWIAPEQQYTRQDFELLFEQLQFMRDDTEEMIFVIADADTLPPACFNSLLKSLEEPPAGYHFIFMAQRLHAVAVTIRSRCLVLHDTSGMAATEHPLLSVFCQTQVPDAALFAKTLEQHLPDERETLLLVDELMVYWIQQRKQALTVNDIPAHDRAEKRLQLFAHALHNPPLSGSNKLFWRQLFVAFMQL